MTDEEIVAQLGPPPRHGTPEAEAYWRTRHALVIADENQKYQQRQAAEQALAARKHGHEFGRERQCRCGLFQIDYWGARAGGRSQPPCPLLTA